MDSRERIKTIIAGQAADRCGFWMGNPHHETWPIYMNHFAAANEEALRKGLRDDFRWITPSLFPSYKHPEGRPLFSLKWENFKSHGQAGPFADCEDVNQVHEAEWPNPDYLDFTECLDALKAAGPHYRASGMWTCFYHDVMDLFGMEYYMTKMCMNPEVVHAVTDHVCGFYYEANERFFAQAGDLVDAFFFGNDFGTQMDLICSVDQFDTYILPWFRKFTEQGHRFGHQVILHSCGAIHRVIDRLIDAGVNCLHPLQAKAANMDAETLARDFKGRITFMGGVDTQQLLVEASPGEVKAEVRRLKALLGPCFIVSPSHEALLSNVPPENVKAMAEAATE